MLSLLKLFVINEAVEAELKKQQKIEQERMEKKVFPYAKYVIDVPLIKCYSDNIVVLYPLFMLFAIFGFICTALLLVVTDTWSKFLREVPIVVLLNTFFISVLIFMKRTYRYATYTKWGVYEDKVGVVDYRNQPEYYSYSEIREQIISKKIRVRKGRVEIPLREGFIVLSCINGEERSKEFAFICKKARIEVPDIKKSFGPIRLNSLPKTLWLSGLFIVAFLSAILCLGDFMDGKFNTIYEFAEYARENMFGIWKGFGYFTLSQLVIKILFWVRLKIIFAKYQDIIKVS